MSGANQTDIPVVGGFFLPKSLVLRLSAVLVALVGGLLYHYGPPDANTASSVPSAILGFLKNHRWAIHLSFFGSWFGCSMWVSFVSGLVLFKNLPRHVFGRVQAKLFPRYFQWAFFFLSIPILVDLVLKGDGLIAKSSSGWGSSKPNAVKILTDVFTTSPATAAGGLSACQLQSLLAIFGVVVLNLFYFEPKTTEVMFKRHKVEARLGTGHEIGQLKPSDPEKAKDPELVALTKTFGKLHGCSTSLNLIGLCLGIWHWCWLGSEFSKALSK